MEFIKKSFNLQDYRLSFLQENIETISYSLICFLVPFFIGHPQMAVGILVNTALVLAALNVRSYKILPVIILPSLGVMSRGMIFGPFTVFLLIMAPFIWIGNSILVYSFKKLMLEIKMSKWAALFIGAFTKTAFLFSAAFVLVKMGYVPAPIMNSMGLMQLYTALIGGTIALSIHQTKKLQNNLKSNS